MLTVFGSLIVLFGIPLLLQAQLPPVAMLAYLFAVNLAAGAVFWRRAAAGRPGSVRPAIVYLVSGVTLFSLMVEPIGIESMTPQRARVVAGLEEITLRPARGTLYELAGTPTEQAALRRREGERATWFDRLVLQVEAAMMRPPER